MSSTTAGVRGYVCVWPGMHKCALVCVKVCGCLRVCALDEFSEYLLENRVPTSADFNTYPIRIFFNKYQSQLTTYLNKKDDIFSISVYCLT